MEGSKDQGGQIEKIIIQEKSPKENEDMTQEETKRSLFGFGN